MDDKKAFKEYQSALDELEEAASGGAADDFENAFGDLDGAIAALEKLYENIESDIEDKIWIASIRRIVDTAWKEATAILEEIPSDGEQLEATIEKLQTIVEELLENF